ncbi:NF-X1 finger transcription factor [Rasamsonia emersonii CBS 393.64]|uniref:NF-X1 finger transcription factor n=1 Tax=Rasamsonia emersonii (strain ATCC 16479 / CBS 393.64 / IMI 116815) TaxID=1408163 RepID=A0A0F4YNR5_RASE3|nr:NF-X1 finger transcription factor [Rasamsonia emersonii CBS 393.64]KKA19884.1 NF-X1 finger transcription factor [Rasamsonia emersonii CBS 393.64]
MNAIETRPEPRPQPRMAHEGRGRGRGRARGHSRGRGRGSAHASRSTTQNPQHDSHEQSSERSQTPSTLPDTPQQLPQSDNQRENPTSRDSRGKRRGHRGHRRGGAEGNRVSETQTTTRNAAHVGGRTFRGQLTREENNASEDVDSVVTGDRDQVDHGNAEHRLRADVPEFVPGQPSQADDGQKAVAASKPNTKPRATRPPKVTTKSTAPDLATRIHEDIANGLYECPICTSELGRRSRVWSCRLCWTVFHLSCIKKWSQNEGSVFQDQQQRQGDDDTTPRQWRCPGCNLPQDVRPTTYTCWCEKEVDPRPLPGLPPHSCGQTCSRPRKGCPHPCDQTCHAGPCPPCTAMGPTQDCFCGKNSSTKRCVETDYENGWSCGEHICPRPCHEGLCGACEEKVEAKCYCGRVETEILCSSTEEEIISQRLPADSSDGPETWVGSFSCGEICNRPFDCGVHFCQKRCHPQDANPPHCPRSPDVVLRCPCGKTPLSKIEGFSPRTSCEDPIPNCSEPCGKILPCGHPCPMVCHTGACRPCLRTVSIKCRCGRSSFNTICHQGKEEPPQCFRVCKATLNCGRHACSERCCPGERKAIERQASKRKPRSLNAASSRPTDDDIEAEHICTRVCGRMLKCGRHTCPELCHKGPCSTCREAIFEEVSCHCGRSVLYPPLPCGTKPPPCRFECERPKACGHPQTPHNCHTDDESCPKCPFLTEKKCLCGKKWLKNQPCWLTDVRCGLVCGEPLKCGSHSCQKTCHRPGDCEDAAGPCQQPCGKTKKLCGHPCTEPCHAPYPCPETTPCETMVTVTCDCGRLRQERRCNAARAVTSKGQVQQSETLPSFAPLKCDEECARLERNRSLASALKIDIDPSTTVSQRAGPHNISATNLPYSAETLDMYVQLSSSSTLATLQDYEAALHGLATSSTQRSVRFQPARAALRAFVHSLAADWGFASESFDPEPHRHVFVLKPTSWTPPMFGLGSGSSIGIGGMTVGECVRFRERERLKEREAQRAAAAEAKAQREAAKMAAAANAGAGADGWAQVASRRKNRPDTNGSNSNPAGPTPLFVTSGSGTVTYTALAMDQSSPSTSSSGSVNNAKKKDLLVLRSGVGAGKKNASADVEDIADSWEEEVEKEEEEERQRTSRDEQEQEQKQEQEQEQEQRQDEHPDENEEAATEAEVKPEAEPEPALEPDS